MKDADQPETKAYDLTSVHIRTDSDGDDVNSLVVIPVGRPPSEDGESLPKSGHITGNHEAVWQAVRSRAQMGHPTTKAIIIDDLKAQGLNTGKFSRWLSKLVENGSLTVNGDTITMGDVSGKQVDKCKIALQLTTYFVYTRKVVIRGHF